MLLCLLTLFSRPVRAAQKDHLGHGKQFALRVGLLAGYNMIFRYAESPLCAELEPDKPSKDQRKVCGHEAPLALDMAVSYSPLDSIEPYVFLRLGLTRRILRSLHSELGIQLGMQSRFF